MKKKWLGAVACAMVLTGCVTVGGSDDLGGGVHYEAREDIEGVLHMYYSYLYGEVPAIANYAGGRDTITVYRFDQAGKPPQIRLDWTYRGPGWRFMEGGLKIRTDKGLYTLQDDMTDRDVLSGSLVKERIAVQLPENLFQEMASSTSVVMQAWKDPIEVDRVKVRHFYDNYVAVTPVPPPAP